MANPNSPEQQPEFQSNTGAHPEHGEIPEGMTVAGDPKPGSNPGQRLREVELASKNAPPPRIPWRYRLRPARGLSQCTVWDLAAVFSLVVNIILIGLLIVMFGQMRILKTVVNNLLGEVYGDFVRLDQASISATVQLNTQIPLDFEVPVSQNAEVILARDITIPSAHLVFDTGIFNINTQANVTIPAGTSLPVALSLKIPVQTTVPVSVEVPVKIPLNQTGLHEPLTGLQSSLRPLYCLVNRNAQFPAGNFLCDGH